MHNTVPHAHCIFCRIVAGEIPSDVVERDAAYLVIRDITPQAPEHLLVIPVHHIPAISAHTMTHELGDLVAAAARLGKRHGPGGFRLVINEGSDGGQTVDHLHVHVLAGRALRWPPG